MPAPDVRYFLDCSFETAQLAGDAHAYFMDVAPDANEVLDSYDTSNYGSALFEPIAPRTFRNHWSSLFNTALYLEDNFLKWRSDASEYERVAVSVLGLRGFPFQLRQLVHALATEMVDAGYTNLHKDGLNALDFKYGWSLCQQVLSRTLTRARHDLVDVDAEGIQACLSVLRVSKLARRGLTVKQALRVLEEQRQEGRKALKRSLKLMNRFVDSETTRMFVSGKAIVFEGQHANYHLSRTSENLQTAHGGSTLVVRDKAGERLCNVCIYTPKVPVADHVVSILMHIRAGDEKHILDVGNPYNVTDAAYEHEWLLPFLPERHSDLDYQTSEVTAGIRRVIMGLDLPGTVPLEKAERRRRVQAMSHAFRRKFYKETFGAFAPVLRKVSNLPEINTYVQVVADRPPMQLDDVAAMFETPYEDAA